MTLYCRTCAIVAPTPGNRCESLEEREVRSTLRLANVAHERNREEQPPHRDRHERPAYGLARVGETEQRGLADHHHVHEEQNTAAEIAERVAERGDAFVVFRPCDVEQHRIVEDHAAMKTHRADHKQHRGREPFPCPTNHKAPVAQAPTNVQKSRNCLRRAPRSPMAPRIGASAATARPAMAFA